MQKYVIFILAGAIGLSGAFCANLYAEVFSPYYLSVSTPQPSPKCNEFTFDATQSEIPDSANTVFLWDFGDGFTSADAVATHTYNRPGNYTVTLSIKDRSSRGAAAVKTSRNVEVHIPPRASFLSEDLACVNAPLTFDAAASFAPDGGPLSYSWDFGDGETRVGNPYVQKAYRRGGDYKVRLTVNDHKGSPCSSHTAEKSIRINEPPVAQAGNDVILKCGNDAETMTVHFDASASRDVNNDPLEYLWDFGDGYTEKGLTATHHYASHGHYDARLIVSDNTIPACGVDVDFVSVRISQPPRARAGKDTAACVNEPVDFDGSDSYMEKRGTVVARWTFGDGASANGLYAAHRYSRPGTYQAVLSLENKLNRACPVSHNTRTITINAPPAVKISGPTRECAGARISFYAASDADPDGDKLDYLWNFGDGTTQRGGNKVEHRYDHGGHYRVSVVVDDRKGSSCSTAAAQMKILVNTPPTADAGTNLGTYYVGQKALFSAKASSDPDGGLLIYTWDFGDGHKAQTDSVYHTYARPGTYNVFVTVDDRSGTSCSQSTDGFVAAVKELPVPKIEIR